MFKSKLAEEILTELEKAGEVFSGFQKKSGLHCPEGCGKCCENPDIHCAPFELLPLAFELLKRGIAQEYLSRANNNLNGSCMLLIDNRCIQYNFRPYICRSFGVAARHNKAELEFAICKILKENYQLNSLDSAKFVENEIPYIEILRKQFESVDPGLSELQLPINQSLALILEKILLYDSYSKLTE